VYCFCFDALILQLCLFFYTAHCVLSAPHNKRLWVIFITRAHYIVQFAETCPFKALRKSRVLITLLVKYIKISKWGHIIELRKNSKRPSRFCVFENCFVCCTHLHIYSETSILRSLVGHKKKYWYYTQFC